jgi:small subunit ribosomal protein S21
VARKHYQASEEFARGSRVEVRNNDFGKAFRRFKKKLQEDGLFQELREKQYYEKPSVKRKRAKAAARSRWLKKLSQSKNL